MGWTILESELLHSILHARVELETMLMAVGGGMMPRGQLQKAAMDISLVNKLHLPTHDTVGYGQYEGGYAKTRVHSCSSQAIEETIHVRVLSQKEAPHREHSVCLIGEEGHSSVHLKRVDQQAL